jgi:hypothetical protein
VGPRAVLNAVVKRKIPSPRRESNLRTPIPTELSRLLKYTLTCGITRSCPLQSIPLPSSCNGFSVSATAGSTAGTDFLESHVGRSAIVPEFQ